jgi:predicted Zn finger-like uncharacterized protein
MIVSCPVCSTGFEVNALDLGAHGRKVRCVKCRHVWHQEPAHEMASYFGPADEDSRHEEVAEHPASLPNFMVENTVVTLPETPDDSDFAFVRRPPPAAPQKPPRDVVKIAATASVIAATALIILLAYLGREGIVARWPALAPLYASIGLQAEPLGAGLELRGINSALIPGTGGKLSLVVAGEVANISTIPRGVPPLTIHLRDGSNKVLQSWTITPRPGKLPPGATMPFQTSMASPPAAASSAVVTFQP